MSTPTATAPDEETGAVTTPNRRRRLVVVGGVVLVVVLAAAWWFLLRPSDEVHAEEAPQPGAVTTLEPITLNLADGRLLKVGLALQLPLSEGGDEAEAEVNGAVALDQAITYFSGKTYDELIGTDGRQAAKAELSAQVAERYHGEVLEVYFTQFLMQ
ncbi:flagellar basal body-associated protein FliL [Quadrisphaera sp. GCM10027208]|uniref:flagellar basal body-associated FliL family protein n=1 Tax=Quadrisphaera sp. GCM10027208 TaxID=3273423 RepID=UPI003613F2A0